MCASYEWNTRWALIGIHHSLAINLLLLSLWNSHHGGSSLKDKRNEIAVGAKRPAIVW